MKITRLYWISKEIMNKIPHPHKLIDRHYVLEHNEKNVVVFTKHPLKDYKSYLVSDTTIDQKKQNQYITGISYKIDDKTAVLKQTPEANEYLMKNISKLIEIKKEISNFPLIEIAQLISNEYQ